MDFTPVSNLIKQKTETHTSYKIKIHDDDNYRQTVVWRYIRIPVSEITYSLFIAILLQISQLIKND